MIYAVEDQTFLPYYNLNNLIALSQVLVARIYELRVWMKLYLYFSLALEGEGQGEGARLNILSERVNFLSP